MSEEAKSVLFYLSTVAVALAAGSLVVSMQVGEATRQKRKEAEPLLVADMHKAVAAGQSVIVGNKVHIFWLTEKDNGNFKTLRGVYNAAQKNFCWESRADTGPTGCFPLKDASQDFTMAMMQGACKTAEQKLGSEFRKKYCPRFTV